MAQRLFCILLVLFAYQDNNSIIAQQSIRNNVRMTFNPNTYGCFTELLDGDVKKALDIKDLGFGYVILFTYSQADTYIEKIEKDIDLLERYDIGVILLITGKSNTIESIAKKIASKRNLIGWYVYDEPTLHGISKEEQDKKIEVLKNVEDLPCFTSECGAGMELTRNQLSDKYDYVFSDVYVPRTKLDKNQKILDSYALIGKIHKYSIEQILPVYETYWDVTKLHGLKSNLLLKQSLFINSGAFFIYSAEETQKGRQTISNSHRLRSVAEYVMRRCQTKNTMQIFNYDKDIEGRNINHVTPDSVDCRFEKPVTAVRVYYVFNNIHDKTYGDRIIVKTMSNNGERVKIMSTVELPIEKKEGSFTIVGLDSKDLCFSIESNKNMHFSKLICVGISQ